MNDRSLQIVKYKKSRETWFYRSKSLEMKEEKPGFVFVWGTNVCGSMNGKHPLYVKKPGFLISILIVCIRMKPGFNCSCLQYE
ncbi:MAG: hypothetical protein CVU46_09725 [Chloroflexi bacterium HGW-Chloroflexi-8]|jgi:hypothetical protein|nr:MAG: hypothetical protein CVU46_09725 [Chloroflexi bacterium HGW-Chloroflexi-8]